MDRSTMGKQQHRRLFGAPRLEPVLLTVTAAALVAGSIARLAGAPGLADLCWALGTVAAVGPALGWVLADLRRGHAGVDVIAFLALGGTLLVHEYLAGALIALMLATGRTLEAAAQRRASRDLRALLERAPRTARLLTDDGVITVPSAQVAVGDLLVVGPGEVVPVDGRVAGADAVLDESALTGEPLTMRRVQGDSPLPLKKFLVAARTDRGGISASAARIEALVRDLGFDGYFETSAKEGWNIATLAEAIREGIDWRAMPRVSSTLLFQHIKTFLLDEKVSRRLLSTTDDLFRAFLRTVDAAGEAEELRTQFETCISLGHRQATVDPRRSSRVPFVQQLAFHGPGGCFCPQGP